MKNLRINSDNESQVFQGNVAIIADVFQKPFSIFSTIYSSDV